MKFKVYRIQDMGECEAASGDDAIAKAKAGDVRFGSNPDIRFLAKQVVEEKPRFNTVENGDSDPGALVDAEEGDE